MAMPLFEIQKRKMKRSDEKTENLEDEGRLQNMCITQAISIGVGKQRRDA